MAPSLRLHGLREDLMPKTESINRVQEQARKQVRDLNEFDYNAPAELFPTPSKTHTGNLRYKRFDTAAEALRFAVEEIPRRHGR